MDPTDERVELASKLIAAAGLFVMLGSLVQLAFIDRLELFKEARDEAGGWDALGMSAGEFESRFNANLWMAVALGVLMLVLAPFVRRGARGSLVSWGALAVFYLASLAWIAFFPEGLRFTTIGAWQAAITALLVLWASVLLIIARRSG